MSASRRVDAQIVVHSQNGIQLRNQKKNRAHTGRHGRVLRTVAEPKRPETQKVGPVGPRCCRSQRTAKSISDDRDDQTGYFSQQNTKQVTFWLQVLTSKGHEVTSGVSTF